MTGGERATGLTGRTVPGGCVRVALLLASLTLVALAGGGRGLAFPVTLLVVLAALGTAAAPGSLLPGVLLAAVVVVELADGRTDIGVRLAVTILMFHLVHVLAALAAVIPAASRVEVAVLVPSAVRFVAVQVVAMALVVAGRFVPADAAPLPVLVALAVAASALACAPLILLRRR